MRPAVGGRDIGGPHQHGLVGAFGQHEVAIAEEDSLAAGGKVERQGAGRAVHAEEDHLAGAVFGHFNGERVVGVEHAVAVCGDALDDHALDAGQASRGFRCLPGRGDREAILSTTPTMHLSKARPERRMPPRAVSSTATSTRGCCRTASALRGPAQSPFTRRTPPK